MRLRGAVIGLGSVGRHHARIVDASPRVELVGAVETNGHDAGLEGERIFRTWRDLRARKHVDFAVVALPTDLHEEAAVEVVSAGVHVLVEKPLAASRDGAHMIVEVCTNADVHGAVAHVERHNPAVIELRRRLLQGDIGRLVAIASERGGPLPPRSHERGVISDLATHDLDLVPWLCGDRIEFVFAQTGNGEPEHVAAITGRLSSGVVFNTMVDWLSGVKTRRLRVIGDEGTLLADLLAPSLLHMRDGVRELPLAATEPLAGQFNGFCDLLEGRPDAAVVSLSDGLAAVATADAAIRSAREGRPITL